MTKFFIGPPQHRPTRGAAMISIVASGFAAAKRHIDRAAKQARYATAASLTRTAKRLQNAMEDDVRATFDRPTKFVQHGFFTRPANISNLTAIIGIKDRQAKVLLPHIVGGARNLKTFEQKLVADAKTGAGYWMPGDGIRLNASGNMTNGQITQIAEGLRRAGKYKDIFVGVPAGHPGAPSGIWGG